MLIKYLLIAYIITRHAKHLYYSVIYTGRPIDVMYWMC